MRNFWPKYVKCCVKLKLYSPNQHACLEKRNDSNKRQVSPEKRKISGISFITLHVRDKIILSDIRESKLRKQIECAWSMESAEEELNPKCVPKVYYDLYTVLVSILWYLNAFQWSHGMLHVPGHKLVEPQEYCRKLLLLKPHTTISREAVSEGNKAASLLRVLRLPGELDHW